MNLSLGQQHAGMPLRGDLNGAKNIKFVIDMTAFRVAWEKNGRRGYEWDTMLSDTSKLAKRTIFQLAKSTMPRNTLTVKFELSNKDHEKHLPHFGLIVQSKFLDGLRKMTNFETVIVDFDLEFTDGRGPWTVSAFSDMMLTRAADEVVDKIHSVLSRALGVGERRGDDIINTYSLYKSWTSRILVFRPRAHLAEIAKGKELKEVKKDGQKSKKGKQGARLQ